MNSISSQSRSATTPGGAAITAHPDPWERLVSDAEQSASHRAIGVPDHRPAVAVLSCSDARVPPSVVFGRPAGELFVVRIAGNTASPSAVASLEYAVDHLGVELLVVLGHTHCGAVAAAIGGACDGSLAAVVSPICELSHRTGCTEPDALTRLNVASTMHDVAAASPAIAAAVAQGRLTVRGAVYDMASGDLDEVRDVAALD